jgi:hypothetical protein
MESSKLKLSSTALACAMIFAAVFTSGVAQARPSFSDRISVFDPQPFYDVSPVTRPAPAGTVPAKAAALPVPSIPELHAPDDGDGAGNPSNCPTCKNQGLKAATINSMAEKIAVESGSLSAQSRCYSQQILWAAKRVVRRRYGNQSASGGWCSAGVQNSLMAAGVGGVHGDAVDLHKRPLGQPGSLSQNGFRDVTKFYPTAETAPPGAVLVFSGPRTDEYWKTGHYPSKKQRRKMGLGAGTWVGHVTIKGDDGRYYTDARTRRPARSDRKLVGVYVMETCVNCSKQLRKACGD